MIDAGNKTGREVREHLLGPTPNHPNATRKEGLCMSMAKRPDRGQPAAKIIPLGSPSRADLWARHQLAIAALNHGRVDRAELLAILNGAAIADLLPKSVS